ncbi:MAG: CRISPR-associated endonuclease Cas1 [candidate division WOR-3 bacterium]|nr:CRISPR-associated endonuclease Cas1 [candidate division WOR-3 bacterium]
MASLYITEQGARLTRTHSRLIIEKEDKSLLQVPIIKIDNIVIFGRVSITIPVIELILNEGIPCVFLSINGRLKGTLEPVKSKNIILRYRQYEKAKNEQFRVMISRSIVYGKIRNQKRLIQRFANNHPEIDFASELQELDIMLKHLQLKNTISAIMGTEGQATAIYFRAYAKLFKGEIGFEQRTRHPPRNQVNALLSLGYTLLVSEYLSLISGAGFDPYLGFYHGISYGRPSLALDIVEELRHPVIDMLALELIGRQMLKKEDFTGDSTNGFFLSQEGKRTFFTQYEKRMNNEFQHPKTGVRTSIRKVMRDQVEILVKAVEENLPYEPFIIG